MTRFDERDRFVFTIVAIAASVFLFACGGGEQTGSGETFAERVKAARSGRGMPASASVAESPAGAGAAQPEPVQAPAVDQSGPPEPAAAPAETAAVLPAPQAPPLPVVQMEPQRLPESEPLPPPIGRNVGSRVFSNKDLQRYRRTKEDFGFRDGVVVVDVTKKPADASAADGEEKAGGGMTRAERDAELEATQAKIRQLMAEADYLRKRVLPLENPFVARSSVSEQDKLAESGMDNAERLQRVKQRIAELDGELAGLQRRFAELQMIKPTDTREESPDAGTPDRE